MTFKCRLCGLKKEDDNVNRYDVSVCKDCTHTECEHCGRYTEDCKCIGGQNDKKTNI